MSTLRFVRHSTREPVWFDSLQSLLHLQLLPGTIRLLQMSLNPTKVAPAGSATGNFFALEVADVQFDTADSLLVRFAVPDALKSEFAFEPGQHLILRATMNGIDVRRPYSICSAIQDNTLRIAIKRAQSGLFSN